MLANIFVFCVVLNVKDCICYVVYTLQMLDHSKGLIVDFWVLLDDQNQS